jgi:hypothetical protein
MAAALLTLLLPSQSPLRLPLPLRLLPCTLVVQRPLPLESYTGQGHPRAAGRHRQDGMGPAAGRPQLPLLPPRGHMPRMPHRPGGLPLL